MAVAVAVVEVDGETLRRIRRELGLSRADLARRLAYSPRTIAAWERGERHVPTGRYRELWQVFSVTAAERAAHVEQFRAMMH